MKRKLIRRNKQKLTKVFSSQFFKDIKEAIRLNDLASKYGVYKSEVKVSDYGFTTTEYRSCKTDEICYYGVDIIKEG